MALLLEGRQIPFRSQQEIQARLQSRDAVDEQEQMHARLGQFEIERRVLVAWQGFVQHGAKLVFGDAANARMPGSIYISFPDDAKSFVAGTFEAEIRKPAPPKPKQPKATQQQQPKPSG